MNYAATVLSHLVTTKDGVTHDLVRWLALLAVLIAFGLEIYVVAYKGQPFDLQNFGIGVGSLFVSVGAALRLKESSEPQAPGA